MAKLGDYVQFDQPTSTPKKTSAANPLALPGKKPDLNTVEGLLATAKQNNLGTQAQAVVDRKPFNPFQTLMSLLNRGQYASAGAANEIAKGVKGQKKVTLGSVLNAAKEGVTGTPTSYSDVLQTAGVKNPVVRGVAGFAGDVALDPTTYLAPEKFLAKPAEAVLAKIGEKAPLLGKAAEATGKLVTEKTQPLRDAFGTLFVHGYGTTKGLAEDVSKVGNRLVKAKSGIVQSALDRLSLPKQDEEKVFNALVQTRLAEYGSRTGSRIKRIFSGNEGATFSDVRQAVDTAGNTIRDFRVNPKAKIATVRSLPTKIKEALALGSGRLSKSVEKDIVDWAIHNKYDVLDLRGIPDVKNGVTVLNHKAIEGATGFAEQAINLMRRDGVSEKTISVMEEQLKRAKGFAGKAGLDNPYEAYFPFLKQENLKKIEQSVNNLKVGSMGYIKKFQAKLKPEEIIHSIPEAYARREYQIVRDKITKDALDHAVQKYGKQFASEEEARLAGYVPLREKGQFGNVLGYVTKKDQQFLQNTFNPEYTTIDKIAKATGYDAATRLWKTAVTKYFPAFHARNFLSGVEQNYQAIGAEALNPNTFRDAVKLSMHLAGKKESEAITLGKKTFKLSQLARAYEDRFGGGDWRHIADIGESIFKERNLSIPGKVARIVNGNPVNKFADSLGSFVETNQKMVAYLASLKQGKSIDEALKVAEGAGFDYSRITDFEQRIMKRIIPFYSFTRKNLELQGKTLLEHPGRTAVVGKLGNAVSTMLSGGTPTAEEQAGLPDFIQQGQNIRTGKTDKYGRPLYVGSFGTAPEAAAQQFAGNPIYRTISQSNPILKYIFEKGTGINTFRSASGTEVKIADVKNADKYADAPSLVQKFLKLHKVQRADYVNGEQKGTRDGYDADPDRLHLLESLPTSRLLPTIIEAVDQAKGKSAAGKTTTQTIVDLLTGGKLYAVDPAEQKYFKDKQRMTDLIRLLEGAGVIKTFSTPYVPKK